MSWVLPAPLFCISTPFFLCFHRANKKIHSLDQLYIYSRTQPPKLVRGNNKWELKSRADNGWRNYQGDGCMREFIERPIAQRALNKTLQWRDFSPSPSTIKFWNLLLISDPIMYTLFIWRLECANLRVPMVVWVREFYLRHRLAHVGCQWCQT
jgi:hypothetical protein